MMYTWDNPMANRGIKWGIQDAKVASKSIDVHKVMMAVTITYLIIYYQRMAKNHLLSITKVMLKKQKFPQGTVSCGSHVTCHVLLVRGP